MEAVKIQTNTYRYSITVIPININGITTIWENEKMIISRNLSLLSQPGWSDALNQPVPKIKIALKAQKPNNLSPLG